jgi:uncharacterized protein (DUF433 family)
MAIIVPIQYIEVVEEYGETIARIAGTRLTVGEIALMHIHGDSSVDWIVENFDAVNHAQVYAALSYYYDHQAEIDDYMKRAEAFVESKANSTLADLIANTKDKPSNGSSEA